MSRPVLLGGITGPQTRSALVWYARTWLPVVICIVAILCESTDTFSSAHTRGWLRHLAEALFGPIRQISWDHANFAVRKTGHFLGYGLMGLAWLRAWLLTWLHLLHRRGALLWRSCSVAMALFSTLLCATSDEIHQTYIPSRTGLVSDAWLDTSGATVLILLMVLSFWRRGIHRQSGSAT